MKSHLVIFDRWVERVKTLARHKHAEAVLAFIAFSESIIFPIPTAVLMVAMAQSEKSKAWRYAFISAVMSILGGIVGYILGWFAYESLALPILEKLGKVDSAMKFKDMTSEYGGLAVFGAGLTPFPYKVITILSGALKINFFVFIIASVFARFGQFFLIAALVWKFGEQAETLIKKHLAKFTIAGFAFVVIGWLTYKHFTGH